MKLAARLVLPVALAASSMACTGPTQPEVKPPSVAPTAPTHSESPAPRAEFTSCKDLKIPFDREVNTFLDRQRGTLEFSYYVAKLQRDRTITIHYEGDNWCDRNPQAWRLLLHAFEADESLCLDLPTKPREGMSRVELWFGDRELFSLAPTLVVKRDIPTSPSLAADTLRAWIAGPTKSEMKAGAYPSAPEGTELLGIDINDGTAVVDLSEDFERTNLGTTGEGAILNHLAGTITQFDTVDRGLLKIEGEFKDYYLGHGFIVNERHPLLRPGPPKHYRVAALCD